MLYYSSDADATRAFFRDVLELPYVDIGDNWLILTLPPAELGVHPAASPNGVGHEMYLMCDDIDATVETLRGKGVEFTSDISEESWGRLISMRVPGGGELGLYQPKHPLAPR